MNSEDLAQKNRKEQFGDHASPLTETDPEFVTYFENFAFGEVIAQTTLPPRLRLIFTLGALIGCQALTDFRIMLDAALNVGVTPIEAKEVIYQAVPYVGIGKAVDFIVATNEVLTSRGVTLPLSGQSTTTRENRQEKGYAVQGEIIGFETLKKMYATAPSDLMHIQHFLSANCFGDHYTRSGLDIQTRELLTLAILAAHGGCDPQVRGHVGANLNVGNGRAVMIDMFTQLLPFIGYPRTLNAIAALNAVVPAAEAHKSND
ncbi:carboxymuconolactone decarboxylase family protein [Gluconobacter kanchanaburiensis]|uniref:Carboxymuconolactone decarboxylase n=1 Tax=Gluconobacter kanchanaburiensis NBRC 103587 TaxID=1307948 RepID=A0A511BI31_9PROT|nr:carboxymuconolactone decarboxylase family protein [Gluconobacter kanchanaburiensis]MBF0863006.1 carboxymuconolactone decarboxylase family protein [Gluconobacter kanchanaburiensis]GBR71465.1 carboxymuconolactone decarboxylase-like protein [Gluconobacter kanchanaburiensis NBRC 103587]GEK97467.1 carboxymuconolactone decarboxylase [Gluconobacter kanchanaburiensis NBRC 103587]